MSAALYSTSKARTGKDGNPRCYYYYYYYLLLVPGTKHCTPSSNPLDAVLVVGATSTAHFCSLSWLRQ